MNSLKHTSHDPYFKAIVAENIQKTDLISAFIPHQYTQYLDCSQIHLDHTSFIDEGLGEYFSDINLIVKLKTQNQSKNINISLLIEHKSYNDKLALFQVGDYLMKRWMQQKQVENNICWHIPILVYHINKSKKQQLNDWKYPLSIWDELPAEGQIFKQFNPGFELIAVNLNKADLKPPAAALMFMALSRSLQSEEDIIYWLIKANVKEVGKTWSEHFIRQTALYLFHNTQGISYSKIIHLIKKEIDMGNAARIIEDTLFDEAIHKGELKGKLEGKLEGKLLMAKEMFKAGAEFHFVQKCSGLSDEQLNNIDKTLEELSKSN